MNQLICLSFGSSPTREAAEEVLEGLEKEIKKVPKGRYILLPITEKTEGHGTNSPPAVWGDYLRELLAGSAR